MLMGVLGGDWRFASAAGHPEDVGKITVAPDVGADDAVRASRPMLQDGGAGAVAKKHTGIAIGPVRDRGQFFRADHEHGFVSVRGNELLSDLERKKKSGARGGD